MRELRVAVVDDDYWKRAAMAQELDAHPSIAVVHAIDQDEAVRWSAEQWERVDIAVVDVFDENAPSEVGTDIFSGIAALDHLKYLPVRTLAITPHCQHPLVQLRILHAQADWVYHRWEVNDVDLLVDALLHPRPDHRPQTPTPTELERHGARHARPNQAVATYQRSVLHGLVRPDIGLKSLHLPRRTIDRFRRSIRRTGFDGTEDLSVARTADRTPRWPDVRDYVLTVLGRRDVPASEIDRTDALPPHTTSEFDEPS